MDRQNKNRRSSRMQKLTTAAFAAFLGATAPLAAQSAHSLHSDQLLVQNNRDVPVDVYLDTSPVDMHVGTIAPFQSAMMTIPSWVVRKEGTLDVVAIPEGQIPLKGRAELQEGGPNFALVVPPTEDQDVKVSAPSLAELLYPQDMTGATVTVRNDGHHKADVFVQAGAFDSKLGVVPGNSVMTFRVPDHFVGMSSEVVVAPHEGSVLTSQAVHLDEGHHVSVTVE
jgi:hypothetical protein